MIGKSSVEIDLKFVTERRKSRNSRGGTSLDIHQDAYWQVNDSGSGTSTVSIRKRRVRERLAELWTKALIDQP